MFVGFIHGYFEDLNKCFLYLVRVSVLFLILLFVLLSIKENNSTSKTRSKASTVVAMCFTVSSKIEYLPPGIMSYSLFRPEREGASLDQKVFS